VSINTRTGTLTIFDIALLLWMQVGATKLDLCPALLLLDR
jgi:hypothetical protein